MVILKEINKIISDQLWFDLEIESFDGSTLILKGGIDLFNSWMIKITFNEVSMISIKSDWKKLDEVDMFRVIDKDSETRIKNVYFIESKYTLFGISHEDMNSENSNEFFIAAERIHYQLPN